MSKVRRIRVDGVSGTILSDYNYTGGGRPAIVDMPQPGNPTASYTATYDACHRLVKLASRGTTITEL
jgi:hypothetical protein